MHIDPEIRGGPVSKMFFFLVLWALVWSKNKGGVGPSSSFPRSATKKDDFPGSDTGGSEKKDTYSVGVEPMTLGLYFHTRARRSLKRK